MLVAGLNGAEVPLSCARMPFSASERRRSRLHLLALVDRIAHDLAGHVGRVEERTRRDLAALDLGLGEEPAGVELEPEVPTGMSLTATQTGTSS